MNEPRKVAFVSAGASGIGRAIARGLKNDGYDVYAIDISPEHVASFVAEFGDDTALVCDVSDHRQVDRAIEALKPRVDRIDVLVNNAGIAGPTAAVENIPVEEWQKTVEVDLNSAFYVSRHFIPIMKAQCSGLIINMASNASLHGFPYRSPYAASKWALVGLAKTWAMELGRWNIRVNALCPGSVSGPRIDRVIESDARERGMTPAVIRSVYERQSSLRVFIDAEDVAAMVGFLASERGAKISGQAIAIDGHTEGLTNWLDP